MADPNDNGDQSTGIVARLPLPMNVIAEPVEFGPGERFLMLGFNTPVGEFTFFIPGDYAVQWAHDVQIKANQAKSGIVTPSKGIIRPDGGS